MQERERGSEKRGGSEVNAERGRTRMSESSLTLEALMSDLAR